MKAKRPLLKAHRIEQPAGLKAHRIGQPAGIAWRKRDNRRDRSGGSGRNGCMVVLLVLVVVAIVSTPCLVLGPHMVVSVDISRKKQTTGTQGKDEVTGNPAASNSMAVGPRYDSNEAEKTRPFESILRRFRKLFSREGAASPDPPTTKVAQVVSANNLSYATAARVRGVTVKGGRPADENGTPAVKRRDLCVGMVSAEISDVRLAIFAGSFREVAVLADLVLFVDTTRSEATRVDEIIENRSNDGPDDEFETSPGRLGALQDEEETVESSAAGPTLLTAVHDLAKYDILAIKFDPEELLPKFLRRYDTSSSRWVFIQRLLDARGSHYERVLMVDVADFMFQADPFDIIGEPGLYGFISDRPIRQYPETRDKITSCMGPSALAQVTEEPNYYSGVTLGTGKLAAAYASRMSTKILSPTFQKCETEGVDRGLHNIVLHTGGVEGLLRFDQATGPLVDVQSGQYELSDGRVRNLDGREAPIVRYYAHDGDLVNHVFDRYVHWQLKEGERLSVTTITTAAAPATSNNNNNNNNNNNDKLKHQQNLRGPQAIAPEHATVARSADPRTACKGYSIRERVDLFRATCDLSHKGARSVEDCCKVCEDLRACKAFSFDGGSGLCYTKSCNRQTPSASADITTVTSGFKTS